MKPKWTWNWRKACQRTVPKSPIVDVRSSAQLTRCERCFAVRTCVGLIYLQRSVASSQSHRATVAPHWIRTPAQLARSLRQSWRPPTTGEYGGGGTSIDHGRALANKPAISSRKLPALSAARWQANDSYRNKPRTTVSGLQCALIRAIIVFMMRSLG